MVALFNNNSTRAIQYNNIIIIGLHSHRLCDADEQCAQHAFLFYFFQNNNIKLFNIIIITIFGEFLRSMFTGI